MSVRKYVSTYQLDNQSHQVTPLDRSAVHVVVRLSNGVEEWFQKKTEAYSRHSVHTVHVYTYGGLTW